ncbi:MAG: NADH:flavin oxidoreductase [Desulfitobacteriaceae bacterium]
MKKQIINQDHDGGKNKYPQVFRPLKVGSVNLPNRIVFPAMQVNFANLDGTISKKLQDFYLAPASGGCGLVFTGAAVVSSDTVAFDRVMRIDKDNYIPRLKGLFSKIEEYGSVPGIQLIHYGRQALSSVTGSALLAPSALPCPIMSQYDPNYKVKEMTLEDITGVRQAFIEAAVRAAQAGAKVVEVHAAHGYLLNQFLSPYSNRRNDDYGGTELKRARLTLEIIEGIRAGLGSSIAISLRVSGDEFVKDGLTPASFKSLLPLFVQAGIDMFNVTAGVYESAERIIPASDLGPMPNIEITAELKGYTKLPICAVGLITTLEMAETILSSDKADLVAIGRGQIADPEMVIKSASGRETEIQECIGCNQCEYSSNGDSQLSCSVNPELRRG